MSGLDTTPPPPACGGGIATDTTIDDFLSECCVVDPQSSCGVAEAFDAYKAWGGPIPKRIFGLNLRQRFTQYATGKMRRWRGFELLEAGYGASIFSLLDRKSLVDIAAVQFEIIEDCCTSFHSNANSWCKNCKSFSVTSVDGCEFCGSMDTILLESLRP